MKFRIVYGLVIAGLLNTACKSAVEQPITDAASAVKPNILIIHVDDLGYHDLSFTGSEIYQTPNIDAFAEEAVVFTNAYANYPRCVPSRYAMMTGGYPIKDGDVPDDGFEMNTVSDTKNYIKQIDASGYQTAYFGKWHLGGGANNPQGFGFDISVAAGAAGSPMSYLYPINTPKGKGQPKKEPIPDVDALEQEGDYLTDLLTDQVLDYIKNRDTKQPFMAMLAFYAVHQPIEAKEADTQRNQAEIAAHDFGNLPEYIEEGTGRTKMRQDNAEYAAMVENMDANVGRILKLLDELDLDENTLVLLSSDHGGLSNDGTNQRQLATSNYPLRAGKGWLYEGGIKVPLFARWKSKLQPHTTDRLTLLMDVFPTVLDLTQGKTLETDGQSFLPALQGRDSQANRMVYWHSPNARPANTGDTPSSAIRVGDYKLINWYKEDRFELYNLKQDPFEQTDLSKTMPDKVNELAQALNDWKANL